MGAQNIHLSHVFHFVLECEQEWIDQNGPGLTARFKGIDEILNIHFLGLPVGIIEQDPDPRVTSLASFSELYADSSSNNE